MLKNRHEEHVKESSNGHVSVGPTMRAPQIVRELAGLDDLPFNELEEVAVALTVAGELAEDVIARIDARGEPWDQLRLAAAIQHFYTARLISLWQRIERGDEATIKHVLGDV